MTAEEVDQTAAQFGWTEREDYDDLTRRGLALYESRLQARLEPEHNSPLLQVEMQTGGEVS